MEQSPSSEAVTCATGQETACLLRKAQAMVHYRVCKFLSSDTQIRPTLSHATSLPPSAGCFLCLFNIFSWQILLLNSHNEFCVKT